MNCQQRMCQDTATCVVFWPGQITRQCERHAIALSKLANHVGFNLEIGRLLPFVVIEEDPTVVDPDPIV